MNQDNGASSKDERDVIIESAIRQLILCFYKTFSIDLLWRKEKKMKQKTVTEVKIEQSEHKHNKLNQSFFNHYLFY